MIKTTPFRLLCAVLALYWVSSALFIEPAHAASWTRFETAFTAMGQSLLNLVTGVALLGIATFFIAWRFFAAMASSTFYNWGLFAASVFAGAFLVLSPWVITGVAGFFATIFGLTVSAPPTLNQ